MDVQQYAVIGMGRFGASLAGELMKLGHQVLGIDKDEEVIDEMYNVVTHAVVADATDEEVLRSLGIRNFDCVIVAIGNDIQTSILVSIQVKEMGVKKVVAKALSDLHGRVLERLGVDRIIYPERDMGIRVAHHLVSPNMLDYIELSKDYTIAELTVPRCLSGTTLRELDPRAKFGCSIVALNKPDGIVIAPTADAVLMEHDIMVMIGTNVQIEHFEEKFMDHN